MTDAIHLTRRGFLRTPAASVAAATLRASTFAAKGANVCLNIAIVGVGTLAGRLMGPLVEGSRSGAPNIRISRVADVYTKRLSRGLDVVT